MSAAQLRTWPEAARSVVLEAARYYYRQMKEPYPVPDVAMAQAMAWADAELAAREHELRDQATDRWIDRWGRGDLDEDMEAAILKIYRQLDRSDGGLRPRAAPRKKSGRQLDAEVATALAVLDSRRRS